MKITALALAKVLPVKFKFFLPLWAVAAAVVVEGAFVATNAYVHHDEITVVRQSGGFPLAPDPQPVGEATIVRIMRPTDEHFWVAEVIGDKPYIGGVILTENCPNGTRIAVSQVKLLTDSVHGKYTTLFYGTRTHTVAKR